LQQIGALCDTGDYESAMRLTDTVSRQLSGRDDPTGRPAFQVLYHSVCVATPQILPVVLLAPSADRTAA
jgi:hypothetical protein